MSEEWSLKGKAFATGTYQPECPIAFEATDIETLRKKLIEDMYDMVNGGGDLCYINVLQQINKRFGVIE